MTALTKATGRVRLKPDATGRPTQLPSSSMADAASYRRWRAALSCCASVVWTARHLPAEIFPYTGRATAFSSVSRYIDVGGLIFALYVCYRTGLWFSRLDISAYADYAVTEGPVRPRSAPRSRAASLSPVETRCRAARRPTAGAR